MAPAACSQQRRRGRPRAGRADDVDALAGRMGRAARAGASPRPIASARARRSCRPSVLVRPMREMTRMAQTCSGEPARSARRPERRDEHLERRAALWTLFAARSPLQTLAADLVPVRPGRGHVGQPDRLGLRPAVRSRHPGHGDGEVAAESGADALRHGERHLGRDRAMATEQVRRHTQESGLHLVGVADDAAQVVGAGARDARDGVADEPAGARLRRADRDALCQWRGAGVGPPAAGGLRRIVSGIGRFRVGRSGDGPGLLALADQPRRRLRLLAHGTVRPRRRP